MTSDRKRKILAWLGCVVILTALLAVVLSRLELHPGVPLPALINGRTDPATEQALPRVTISISTLWKAILGICFLAVLIYNGYRLIRHAPWNWKDIFRPILLVVLPVMIIIVIFLAGAGVRMTPEPISEEILTPIVEQPGPPLGPLSGGLIWVVYLILAASLLGLSLWLLFHPARATNMDRLALQATWALEALKRGADFKNVIVKCYWEMGQVLKEEQGIEMKSAMTVREFELLLESRGVPHVPVHQLTQLFEAVRYGHQAISAENERLAIDALTEIDRYSRATGT